MNLVQIIKEHEDKFGVGYRYFRGPRGYGITMYDADVARETDYSNSIITTTFYVDKEQADAAFKNYIEPTGGNK